MPLYDPSRQAPKQTQMDKMMEQWKPDPPPVQPSAANLGDTAGHIFFPNVVDTSRLWEVPCAGQAIVDKMGDKAKPSVPPIDIKGM